MGSNTFSKRSGERRFAVTRIVLLLLLLPAAVSGPADAYEPKVAAGARGMVVAVSPPAVDVGATVLKQGGTAVDAAVAVALAMAVTWPEAGNIGGGGFMLVHPGGGREPVCFDYRETAPAAATERMFALDESALNHRFVGVPGTVRGLALAHQRFGKLSWKELVMPAVRLAKDGFVVDEPLAKSLNSALASIRQQETSRRQFAEFLRVFAPPSRELWRAGDRLVQPELANTLRLLAEKGPDAFYNGRIAEQLAAEMRTGGGLITQDDLAKYAARERRPIRGTFRGYEIFGPPPPSSGGIVLVEMLNILENFDLKKSGRWSPDTVHLIAEAMRRAYLDRARHLGDPDFTRIPEHLTSKYYAARLAREIDRERASASDSLTKDIPLAHESPQTTHFSIVDGAGMAVANTYTLEHSFGSRVVVRGAGFLLNNEMADFNRRPGHTDRSGRIGTTPNIIAPGKRMLSSQTPTIVTRDGRLVLVTGSPGGRTIINTVLGVVLNRLEFEMSPRDCVAAPRLHHAWLPDRLQFEGQSQAEFKELVAGLRARGHKIDDKPYKQGDAHSIFFDLKTGQRSGVADGRLGGKAATE